jgi:hypothetical protein
MAEETTPMEIEIEGSDAFSLTMKAALHKYNLDYPVEAEILPTASERIIEYWNDNDYLYEPRRGFKTGRPVGSYHRDNHGYVYAQSNFDKHLMLGIGDQFFFESYLTDEKIDQRIREIEKRSIPKSLRIGATNFRRHIHTMFNLCDKLIYFHCMKVLREDARILMTDRVLYNKGVEVIDWYFKHRSQINFDKNQLIEVMNNTYNDKTYVFVPPPLIGESNNEPEGVEETKETEPTPVVKTSVDMSSQTPSTMRRPAELEPVYNNMWKEIREAVKNVIPDILWDDLEDKVDIQLGSIAEKYVLQYTEMMRKF